MCVLLTSITRIMVSRMGSVHIAGHEISIHIESVGVSRCFTAAVYLLILWFTSSGLLRIPALCLLVFHPEWADVVGICPVTLGILVWQWGVSSSKAFGWVNGNSQLCSGKCVTVWKTAQALVFCAKQAVKPPSTRLCNLVCHMPTLVRLCFGKAD